MSRHTTPFSHPTEAWFRALFAGPTAVQREGWARLRAADGGPGGNALLVAPTGSGKTLAAFLAAIDRLLGLPADAPAGVRVLYVSPLKALVHDVEKNLQAPLRGIAAAARAEGRAVRPVRVDMRTGDTPARERRQFRKDPADILVTTPESLFLILGSEAREALRRVETVIVDEIHALCETKRGVHLALSLERLDELVGRRVQRVGLSATVRPLSAVARYLGGEQPVEVVDTHAPPRLDLRVEAFLTDGGKLAAAPPTRADTVAGGAGPGTEASFPLDRGGGWQATYERILELIRAHRSTLIFVNYRRLCERMALRLNEMAGEELVRAHHGSVAREQRLAIEDALKQGQLRALVATGTLELGIDMGAIDLVVLVESPGSAARGLQRVGRAGHQVGGTSIGRIFPRFRADLVECAVVADAMCRGELEALRIPRNCLDVLAQQVVAMVADRDWGVDELYRCVTRASPYTGLPREAWERVLAMLDGAWASGPLVNLSPRLFWDRTEGTLRARRGAAALGRANAGAIPDRGNFGVFLGKGGPRVGELDEEMVYESRKGDTFLLGATTWRIEEITRDQVLVSPAPGQPGRMPFWRGDSPGRPLELGRRIGAFVREVTQVEPSEAMRRLTMSHALDPDAAESLLELLREQRAVTGSLPTDRAITVETWKDESGDLRVNLLTPFGARVHAPWAIAIEATLGRVLGTPVQTLYGDDGITLRLAETDTRPDVSLLLPAPEAVEDLLLERVADTPLFGHRFRESAARALLLPRNAPGRRTPLWQQRIRAQNLLATVKGWPDFPILQETWRECLQDVFDLDGLREVLGGIQAGEIAVDVVDTRLPSPLARSLAWRWVATWLYELDGPAAERRAQVLALDRALLDALLGREAWTELLDPATITRVAAELQHLTPDRRARDAAALLDLLRRLGDLSGPELAARAEGDAAAWAEVLLAAGRAAEVDLAGERRWIAAEDLPLYEHALGARLVRGGAAPRAAPLERAPLAELVLRRAATVPLLRPSELAERWALPPGAFDDALAKLGETGLIQTGVYQRGEAPAWAHGAVLQRLKRRALEGARAEAQPVSGAAFAELLGRWHGLGGAGSPERRLEEAVERLEGAPLPFLDLEARILPARVPGYRPGMLDELGAAGELVWVGCRPLGDTDGRIRLFRRAQLPALWRPPEGPRPQGAAGAVLDALEAGGAQFLVELQGTLGRAGPRLATPELLDLLWELTWAGLVTNDTFQVLRRRGQPGPAGRVGGGGRWFPAARLVGEPVSPERRALAWSEVTLRRHAVVDPGPTAAVEELEGGAGALYPALRALEDAGKARRGAFVEGLGASCFAWPAGVEALRRPAEATTRVLAAADPAQPWGGLLPWPLVGARRAGGARVVLAGGACVCWLDRAGRSLLLAPGEEEGRRAALRALADDAVRSRSSFRVEKLNGEDPDSPPWAALLRAAGFHRDPGGRGWSPPF